MRLRYEGASIAAAAVLLTMAYPPFELVWPAFVCLVPAGLLILRGCDRPDSWRWHLSVGFTYGAVTYGVLLFWLARALWLHARVALPLYAVAVLLFGAATAVLFGTVGRIVRGSPARLVLALPVGVVALEWVAGQVGPLALPWHQLALTVTSAPLLVQVADIAGSEGLGFLLVMVNALLALAWWERRGVRPRLMRLEAAATIVVLMALYGAHRIHTIPLQETGSVGVVQPNVPVDQKWLPERMDAVVERTARLAERALAEGSSELIVWPETSLPDRIESHPVWRARLTQLTRRGGVTVVAGGITSGFEGEPSARANVALLFDPGSDFDSPTAVVHQKQRLVPFVERVPWSGVDLSRDGAGGFISGTEVATADGPIGRIGAVICYELTFSALPRTLRRAGAEVLVVLSNDAWLGPGGAPAQHFAHAVLRAVENRMAVVRSANTGISGIVDPLGRVVARTEPFEETYVVGPVARAGVVPLAVRLGGVGGPAAVLLLVGLTFATPRRKS